MGKTKKQKCESLWQKNIHRRQEAQTLFINIILSPQNSDSFFSSGLRAAEIILNVFLTSVSVVSSLLGLQ